MTKNTFKDTVRIIIGVILLSAGVAYASTWTAPPSTPIPAGFPYNNVDPPINVGSVTQTKVGALTTNGALWSKSSFGTDGGGYFGGVVQIKGGSPAKGKVLTASSTLGDATWQTPTGVTYPSQGCPSGKTIQSFNLNGSGTPTCVSVSSVPQTTNASCSFTGVLNNGECNAVCQTNYSPNTIPTMTCLPTGNMACSYNQDSTGWYGTAVISNQHPGGGTMTLTGTCFYHP